MESGPFRLGFKVKVQIVQEVRILAPSCGQAYQPNFMVITREIDAFGLWRAQKVLLSLIARLVKAGKFSNTIS